MAQRGARTGSSSKESTTQPPGWPQNSWHANFKEMSQGGSPCRGCRSCNIVHQWNHAQLGPLSIEHVPRRLQRHVGLGDRVPLFMVDNFDSTNRVEGAPLLLFL
jgi:hypothetical protein